MWYGVAVLFTVLCACISQHPSPALSSLEPIEISALPSDPETEKLDVPDPTEDWVEPQEAGSCKNASGTCPAKAGISMSEARAARFGLYKIRYRELRADYEADQKVWLARQQALNKQLELAATEIRKLQPGWWDQNKAEFALIGGFLLGTTMTAVVYTLAH
jgi:hypothetical protein